MTRTHVDRGGTFTDVVEVRDGVASARKVPSDRAKVGEIAQGSLTFGTTVATNALLEGRRSRTLLVVTAGFADLPFLRAMARPDLFDPDRDWPPPLADAIREVDERLDGSGAVLRPLRLPDDLVSHADGFDSVAVALLHADRNPAHELALGAALARPGRALVLGHRAAPEPGYLARVETALLDAAITPILRRALEDDGLPSNALAIRSDGSLTPWSDLTAPEAVLSGPAGGVLAVAHVARSLGRDAAVGFDMGGTSTDVCCVRPDRLERRAGERVIAGHVVHRRALVVETIAAGGGSVCWHDGVRLRVGPASAGADPGPQCYGRGGPPTVTDAALQLGLVDAAAFTPPLRCDLVDLPAAAAELVDVAREEMAAAVRRVCGAAGVDPSRTPLVAYGGAAGQHAAAVAERLGMPEVVFHPLASVLSAFGQSLATREEEGVAAVWRPLAEAWPDLTEIVEALDARLPAWPVREVSLDLRPRGVEHALTVPWAATPESQREAWGGAWRETFGVAPDEGDLELAAVRVRRQRPPEDPPRVAPDPWAVGDGKRHGPCRLDGAGTSIVVPVGWVALRVGELLVLRPHEVVPVPASLARSPHGLSLWSSRLTDVALRAGEHLRRLARSVNIRERLDFSCALFDGEGQLVVNAPHIPVHLGAMGETVRDVLRHTAAPVDGDAWLTNDPRAGGSHLPDLTVVTCVVHEGARFFVASRGHHVDVGGVTPGSMPPRATHLDEEGVRVARHRLRVAGCLLRPDALLAGSRQPDVVWADLQAQLAANHHAATLLRALGPAELLCAWMGHLQDAADAALRAALPRLTPGAAEDSLDGVPLRVSVRRVGDRLSIDLSGTGGPHGGNLNAPRAVVQAAVLYVLRVLVDDGLPLNEGALRGVELTIPAPSILAPPAGAAVAGGNVETSQRLVDLLLRALGRRAASQGTMNNLTLGGEGWSLYETLGGGGGASPIAAGRSGRQVHMTNTRATDPEVLERRLPLRIVRFALRPGSGGDGVHRGGDGLIREIEVLTPATAALLATRRDVGAPGLAGGATGAPGADLLRRDGRWSGWTGEATGLGPGDRVRVETPGGGGWGRPRQTRSAPPHQRADGAEKG